jgi:Ca2+-binding EF-hand superfamily protein
LEFKYLLNKYLYSSILIIIKGNTFSEEGRKKIFEIIDSNADNVLTVDELKEASEQGRFNLNDEELREVITRVSGPDAKNITYEKYERYLAKKVEQRKNL